MNEEHTVADALQLLQQGIDALQQFLALTVIGDDSVNHLVVALHNHIVLLAPLFVALHCHAGHA